MEGNSFSIRPIFWRLVIWRFLPFYIGWEIGRTLSVLHKGYSNFDFIEAAIVMLLIAIIMSSTFNKNFHIVVSEGIISGPGTGTLLNRENFLLDELDKSSLDKQTFYEKISG